MTGEPETLRNLVSNRAGGGGVFSKGSPSRSFSKLSVVFAEESLEEDSPPGGEGLWFISCSAVYALAFDTTADAGGFGSAASHEPAFDTTAGAGGFDSAVSRFCFFCSLIFFSL